MIYLEGISCGCCGRPIDISMAEKDEVANPPRMQPVCHEISERFFCDNLTAVTMPKKLTGFMKMKLKKYFGSQRKKIQSNFTE